MISQEGDRRVLEVLASHGSDLSKPAHTIHYLYFKTVDAARAAADELVTDGYVNLRVKRAPSTSLWNRLVGPRLYSCIAETHAVPSEAAVFETTNRMNELAAKHGGEYDGWEASIEE